MRLLRLFLAAGFLPLTLLTLTAAPAGAVVNMNDWHSASFQNMGGMFNPSADCVTSSRYTADGTGVEFSGQCSMGHDTSPGVDQPGEGGSEYSISFEGGRAGAPASLPPGPTVSQNTNTDWDFVSVVSITGGTFTEGSMATSFVIRSRNTSASTQNLTGWNVRCWNADRTVQVTRESGSGGAFISPGATGDRTMSGCRSTIPGETGGLAALWFIKPNGCATPLPSPDFCGRDIVLPATIGPPPVTAGAGEGDDCEAAHTGVLGDAPSTWGGMRSVIGAGTATFAESPYGLCVVERVCLTLRGNIIGLTGVGDETYGPDCFDVEFGDPIVPPESGTSPVDPGTVIPETDAPPDPDTESGFWGAILDLLRILLNRLLDVMRGLGHAIGALGDLLVAALGAVVDAVAEVATAILDGLEALIVPPDGLFDDANETLSATVEDSNLGDWQTTAESGFDTATGSGSGSGFAAREVDGGSGCQGPGVTWNMFEKVGLSGGDTMYPFKACSGTSQEMAEWSRLILTALISVGGFLKIMQMLAYSVGLSKQMSALSHDWSGAVVYPKGRE